MLNNPIARRAVPVLVRWATNYLLGQDEETTDDEILIATDITEDHGEEKTVSILVAERMAMIVAENNDQA